MSSLFRILIFCCFCFSCEAKVTLGVDRLFEPEWATLIKGKKIGLITNQTGVASDFSTTIEILTENQKKYEYTLSCLFAPEHGLYGEGYAGEKILTGKTASGIPIHSLHGTTRRPTDQMLKDVSLLIFDIQDIGSRTYTFISTLFYVMEEAAKKKIPVLVLDRPNPIGGLLVDGPMLEEPYRSFVGYINIPYCHGMTIGELAQFFHGEYKIDCPLHVIPMLGWKRGMIFDATGLPWIPTSPNIPNARVSFYYPATGILGELSMTAIGIGYTLPFQVVAAPWIDGTQLAKTLNGYNLPGIRFVATRIKPFVGRYAKNSCNGVLLLITNYLLFRPYKTQCAIFHAIKRRYPLTFKKALTETTKDRREFFYKICGTRRILDMLLSEDCSFESLASLDAKEREAFLTKREKYLLYRE